MHASQILTADFLDILFEEKNKSYGAYPLRKGYNKRLLLSLFIAAFLCGIPILIFSFINNKGMASFRQVTSVVVELKPVVMKDPEPIVVPPPPPPPRQIVATTSFTTPPLIVKDNMVRPEDMPPVIDELEHVRIASITAAGIADEGFPAPPLTGNSIVAAPARDDDDLNKIFMIVQVESAYPGGMPAWIRFLKKTIEYPGLAVENEITGTVIVKFIVDEKGNVSNVEAASGPEELQEEAVRVIRKSGKWTPAIQNGRQVRSYKKQSIIFQLAQ
jgi:protein TonB